MRLWFRKLAGSKEAGVAPDTLEESWSGDGSRITSPDRRSRRPTSASRAGPHPAPRSLSLADAAADLDARIEAAAAGAGALAPELADTSGGHCTGRSAADARAPPRSTLDLRPATSMPQPLGRISAAPGAPISPDPTAPPPLRRVSSQPRAMGLSSESSLHGSSAATGSAVAGSSDFEARGGSHLGGRGGGSSHGGHSDSGRERRSGMPMAAAPAADAMPAAPKAFWHPAVSTPPGSGTAGPQGQASSQQQQREQQAPAAATPTSVCLRAAAAALAPLPQGPSPRSLVQALAAEGDDEGDACTPEVSGADAAARGLSTGSGSVSLLTFQLRGSGASSMAPSREASIRAGATRSREASTRSRPGGLSLALSRESSVKAGQKPGGSGAGSAGPGASPHERSVSCGRRSYSGLTLADAYSDAVLAQHAGGCGSGDWLGAPMPQRLAEMLDACDPSMQQGAAHVDPFAQPAAPRRSVSRRASRRPSCRTSEAIPEEERDALLLELHAPAQVGSWAQRVTTFAPAAPPPPAPVPAAVASHAGGPDPLLLSAALESLAGTAGGCKQLVGDSELATTTEHRNVELLSTMLHSHHGGSLPTGGLDVSLAAAAGSAPHMLSCSWDVADSSDAARVLHMLPQLAPLGGSAPTQGVATSLPGAPGSAASNDGPGRRASSQPKGSEVSAEWNTNFQRRWKAVRRRAYLQALGLRSLWRVNSPSDRHDPLELLTNDMPACDNGMRRAWSVSRLVQQREEAAKRGSTALPVARRPSLGSLHKDPSLGSLLLGEVAEVC